ncbi:MAG TPA: D-alanyl-D-alanine carboxypeptidase/D-alanyl-D-alanine-endopeptidase [Acidimicrobiales bacterium]|nr:D-alanyl-D-alanine carboxypeptidase/D-alanyl-D-alanine-endopeptidase [Acidimicrobiales bacterium]
MTARQRRTTVVLAVLIALVSGGAAVALTRADGSAGDASPSPAVGVLSPRRAPEAFRDLIADTRLASRVGAFMRSVSSTSCAEVRADDSPILAVHADQLLMPASSLKLTTAAAFLAKAGGRSRFTTHVWFPRQDASGAVAFLALEGSGDPLLATKSYVDTRSHPPKPFTDFAQLAAKLHAAGITRVTGGIEVVDNAYDNERRVPTWSSGYTTGGDVGPLGALAVNDGFSSYAPLVAAPDPGIAAANELRAELQGLGIAVAGATTRASRPAAPVEEVSVESATYANVVTEMLTESDNNTAELLLKELSRRAGDHPATRAAGVAARAAALRTLGIDPKQVQAIDGSGLDRSDRATCDALLDTLTSRPGGFDLGTMLAVAGQTGTLDDRFLDSPLKGTLRAKTGTLDGVTALVGIVDPKATTKLRFAFISNGNFTAAGGEALQDRLVAALATYPEAPPADTLAP